MNILTFKKVSLTLLACLSVASVQAQSDTIEKIKSSSTITVGVRTASIPVSYSLGDGKYGGFHVELCQNIVKAIEKSIGLNIAISYRLVTAANRIPLLQNGTLDMQCGPATNNASRQKLVSFLNTTYVEEVRMLTKVSSGITTIAQLNGKTVVTTNGTTSVELLRKHHSAKGIQFNQFLKNDHTESFQLLESGGADAFVMDSSILAGLVANSKLPKDFQIVGEVISVEPIAIMVRKDDTALIKIGNEVIADMVNTGEMAKLWDKWFVQAIPPDGKRVGLLSSDSTKAAWNNLNNKPMEDYLKIK